MDEGIARLEIWDTVGQERFNSLCKMYMRASHAALIVFDITNAASFETTTRWVDEVRSGLDRCIIFLLGNKLDLQADRRVSTERAKLYADEHNIHYVETSAVEQINVNETLQQLSMQLLTSSIPIIDPTPLPQPVTSNNSCCYS